MKFRAIWIVEYSDGDGESSLCICNTRIFFDLRSTVDSFVHQISYLNLRIFGWRWRIFLTCAYVYSKSSMNCGLFRPSNFLLFESSNIRIEKENLPYLCVCNMHIFEIFDELWTLSSNFLRNEISCYLNRQIFGWRWRILLVRMYIRNLRWIMDSFVHQISFEMKFPVILEYSDGDGESSLLVRMYIRNLRWIVDSFVHQISCYLNSRIFG